MFKVFATPVDSNGPEPYAVAFCIEALKFHGRIVLQSDGERAIKALPTAGLRIVAKGSHQSNGVVERAILQVDGKFVV